MSTATRHVGFPYVDGETLAGADLETDVAAVFAEVNGNLDNSNVASGANISGSKLAAGSIPALQIVTDALTKTQMAEAVMGQGEIKEPALGAGSISDDTVFQDMTGIDPITVSNISIGDIIIMWVQVTYFNNDSGAHELGVTFNIAGVGDVTTLVRQHIGTSDTTKNFNINVMYPFVATATSHIIKPRIKKFEANGTGSVGIETNTSRLFTVFTIPQK